MAQKEFIAQILPGAVIVQLQHGLPAAALIAQVCLETGYGQKISKDRHTGKNSKNLFNIKGTGPAGFVTVFTKEFLNGQWVTVEAHFSAYNSYAESFQDYVDLILTKTRYRLVRQQKNPMRYAQELQRAGYATDPKYAWLITSIIKQFNIEKLVEVVLMADKQPEQTAAEWAKNALAWAKKNNIADGTRPKDPATREEVITMLHRMSNVVNK